MREFKFYTVSDRYVEFLRIKYPNVYSNKADTRVHTRKYLGIVIKFSNYNYYIPVSSPKTTDYQLAGGEYVIKKSIVPIVRIIVKNRDGKKELKGTLRISHMIPVPDSELELYDLDNEPDSTYKDLVQGEMIFIRKNQEKILANANLLYEQKITGNTTEGYINAD